MIDRGLFLFLPYLRVAQITTAGIFAPTIYLINVTEITFIWSEFPGKSYYI